MPKVDFNVIAKGIDGKPDPKGSTIANLLAPIIGGRRSDKQTVKEFGWYNLLLSEKPLELDEADKEHFTEIIKTDPDIFLFFKGQVLEILSKAK